jgi:hypothetical protein
MVKFIGIIIICVVLQQTKHNTYKVKVVNTNDSGTLISIRDLKIGDTVYLDDKK